MERIRQAPYVRVTAMNRRRGRRRGSVALLLILLLLLVCGFLLSGLYFVQHIDSLYSKEDRLSTFLDSGEGFLVPAFAGDISLADEDILSIDGFSPEGGLLVVQGVEEAIFSKNAPKRMNPASTTKILTAIVAIKNAGLEELVTVPHEAVIDEKGASLAGLEPGDVLTMEELLYGLMLPSGNDAANTIAMHLGKSLEGFNEMMNQEAFSIGATHSNFVNAHGLTHEDHYTTVYDLYLILHEAMQLPVFREIASTSSYSAEYESASGKTVTKTWTNGNRYLGNVAPPSHLQMVARKTGTTLAAGSCLALYGLDTGGREYYAIVLKAENRQVLYENMTKLLQKTKQ